MRRSKLSIRAAVEALDEQLRRKRATLASQQDERHQLQSDCADNGDHVPAPTWTSAGIETRCIFCGRQDGISADQLARNLARA